MSNSKAYRQGAIDYMNGQSSKGNPFPSKTGMSKDRVDWFNGWYDAWRITKWGPNKGEAIPLVLREQRLP